MTDKALTSPIGVIDSGIGGLTVARTLKDKMPREPLVFFGDTAHVPYGDKSSHSIRYYSSNLLSYLAGKYHCKCIVVACNTASAIASREIQYFGKKHDIPVFNVIDPVVESVVNDFDFQKVGVIGTKRTISSRAYPNRIHKLSKDLKVVTRSTPLLAPMIEEGFFNNNISQTIINTYLSWPKFKNLDALILGCTHYPYIKDEVKRYFGSSVRVLEGADIVAQKVRDRLANLELLSSPDDLNGGNDKFLVSDFTTSFQRTSEIFFGKEVNLKEVRIWREGSA